MGKTTRDKRRGGKGEAAAGKQGSRGGKRAASKGSQGTGKGRHAAKGRAQRAERRRSKTAKSPSALNIGELAFASEESEQPLVAFNHLPNTAATSMRHLFRRSQQSQDRQRIAPLEPNFAKRDWMNALREIDAAKLRRLEYVAGPEVGHVVSWLDREAIVFTLLRDPVDLAISAARRLGADLQQIYGGASLDPEWCNPQARRVLAGFVGLEGFPATRGPSPDADAWRAQLVDVASRFYIFGSRERFVDSVRVFGESVHLGRRRVPALNVGPPDTGQELNDQLLARIREANWLDIELYKEYADLPAMTKFHSRGRSSGAEDGAKGVPGLAGTGATNSSEPAKQPAEAWARLRVRELERQIRSLQRAAEAQASGAALGAREATEAEADGKVVRGRDGWLYLAHDTNRVLDQITGDLLLSQDDLDGWEEVLEDRFESATEAGAAYALIVPPNQHAVYPEHLPAGIELSEQRPVRQLLERVGGSDPPFIYPLEQLIEGKKERPTYAPVDTHWTDWGAFIGYEALCDALEAQGVELRRLSEDDLEWSEAEIEGDLGSKVSPPERATEWRARIREPSSRLLFDNRIRNRGRELIYETDAAPSKLLVFGESFGYVAIKYLSETFGRVVYAHLSGSFDESLVDREQPDAIATIINERFLIQVPDGFGPTIEEVRKRKGLMNEESARRHKALALRGHVVEELDEPEE